MTAERAGFLTVDLGNSRCKLRAWREASDGAPSSGAEFETGPELPERVADWARRAGAPRAAALTSVASEGATARLREDLAAALDGAPVLEPDPGLDVRCREPAAVGRDRLFAARGAAAHCA